MACKQAAMSWIFNGAGSFEKLPVQEDGPRTYHSERSEESQNECAEAKHIKIQDFSCLTTFHCNSIFALLLSFPKSLNFLLSPQTLPVSLYLLSHYVTANCSPAFRGAPRSGEGLNRGVPRWPQAGGVQKHQHEADPSKMGQPLLLRFE